MAGPLPKKQKKQKGAKKQKKPKLTPYEKQQQKAMKSKQGKKSAQQAKGVMSFDDYFNEAPEIDENEANFTSDSDDFWDDEYSWTMDALHHGELNDAQPSQPDSIHHEKDGEYEEPIVVSPEA